MEGDPSRRKFLMQTGAMAGALALPRLGWGEEAPAGAIVFPDVSELVRHLPPRARYRKLKIADGENGYLVLRKALERVVGSDVLDEELRTQFGEEDEGTSLLWSPGSVSEEFRYPDGERGALWDAWLEKNRRADELLDEASHFTRGAIPEKELQECLLMITEDSFEVPIGELRSILIQRYARTLRYLAKGHASQAVDKILAMSQMARMVAGAGGCLIQHMMGGVALRFARAGIRMAARDRSVEPAELERLSESLLRLDYDPTWCANSLRAELHFFTLPTIKLLADAPDLAALVEVLVKYRGEGFYGAEDDDEEPVLRKLLMELLAGHPQPFDPVATVEIVGSQAMGTLDKAELPGSQRPPRLPADVVAENALWPPQAIELLNWWTWDAYFELEEDAAPLTPASTAAARQRLAGVSNPLGKLLFQSAPDDHALSLWDHQKVDHALTQCVLAGRLFWDKRQRVPKALEELVAEGFLESVPTDPYGDGPLRYDPERGLVWSVGLNAKDDGGQEGDFFDEQEEDWDDRVAKMPRFE